LKHYALIPAKERSSRCPNKNWRPFQGDKNLVEFLISRIPDNFFDKIILSTDKEIEFESDKISIHTRDRSLATTESPVNDTIQSVIEAYNLKKSAYIWLLNPTSPFRTSEDFYKIRHQLEIEKPGSILSVVKIHPFIWKDGQPLFDTAYPRKNTQEFYETYSLENGQFLVFRTGEFLRTKTWYAPDTRLFVQSRHDTLIDIDTEEDFLEAQKIARLSGYTETLKNETLAIDDIFPEPVKDHIQLVFNHFRRYTLAMEDLHISKKDTVVDASCGLGYGSYILSLHAKRVFGLDINHEYLEKARTIFGNGSIGWHTYDEFDKMVRQKDTGTINKIVCIETIEHMPQHEMIEFYNRLRSYLNPGGDMYMTIPLGNNRPSEYNKYHLNEPSIDQVYLLFESHFSSVHFKISRFVNSFGYETKFCFVLLNGYRGELQ
jgi:CMP-N-acetylneuraminic acid synthetase